jgi:hypothetical protein
MGPGVAGERVYYVPTDPEYQRIAVDPGRRGRLFCSAEAARLAGWTRPPASPPPPVERPPVRADGGGSWC